MVAAVTLFLNFRYELSGGGTRPEPEFLHCDQRSNIRNVQCGDITSLVAGRDVLIATHGYNNGQIAGIRALAGLHRFLDLPDTAAFLGVLWPGDSRLGAISYPVEKRTAEVTGRALAKFINTQLDGAASFSFASHSLGARVVLQTVRSMRRNTRSVTLLAAAIERGCLADEYADAFERTDRVAVLASKGDRVLKGLFPIGNLVASVLDPTTWPLSKALGYAGPPPPTAATLTPRVLEATAEYDHGDYMPPGPPGVAVAQAKFREPVAFVRRSFLGQPATWPAAPPARQLRFT